MLCSRLLEDNQGKMPHSSSLSESGSGSVLKCKLYIWDHQHGFKEKKRTEKLDEEGRVD